MFSFERRERGNLPAKLALLFFAILVTKATFLLIDSRPAYFMGDSGSYIATAVDKWIPADRSFVYGFLIRAVSLQRHSLEAMIFFQSLLSALAAWLLAFSAVRFLRVRFEIAALSALLCAVEPLELLSERYIMTEALANVIFASYFCLVLAYICSGKLLQLLAAQTLALLLITVRISFLPDVLLNLLLVPLLSPAARQCLISFKARLRPLRYPLIVVIHLLVSVVLFQVLLNQYRHLYGHLIHQKSALFYADGIFLLAAMAPLAEPEDYPIAFQRAQIFQNLTFDRREIKNRQAEHWSSDGLCGRIEKLNPDFVQANDLARATAVHAMLRNPAGVFGLAWQEFLGYFDLRWFKRTLLEDEGWGRTLSPQTVTVLERDLGVAAPTGYQPSFTKWWHQRAWPWYLFVLCFLALSPALLVLVRTPQVVACIASALVFFAGVTVTVERPTARFLTTGAWLCLLLLAVLAEVLAARRDSPRRFFPATRGCRTASQAIVILSLFRTFHEAFVLSRAPSLRASPPSY